MDASLFYSIESFLNFQSNKKPIDNITKRYFWIDIGESSYERSMVRFRW